MTELFERLGDLDSLVTQKRLLARSLRKGAEPMRLRMQELAPIDPEHDEHILKEEMTTSVQEQLSTQAYARIGPSRKGFYGLFEEFGTIRQAAAPFIRPAWDEKIDEVLDLLKSTLWSEIEKAAKKEASALEL
jgi:HK97 gp10 family phage protein